MGRQGRGDVKGPGLQGVADKGLLVTIIGHHCLSCGQPLLAVTVWCDPAGMWCEFFPFLQQGLGENTFFAPPTHYIQVQWILTLGGVQGQKGGHYQHPGWLLAVKLRWGGAPVKWER